MQVTIHSQNINVTTQIEEFAQSKLGKFDRYLPNINEIRLDLSRKNTKRGADIIIAQITLRHARGAILRAEERTGEEVRDATKKAINAASEKMFRQIERFKGKTIKSRRRGGKLSEQFFATPEELETAEQVPNYEEIAAEYANDIPEDEIVRRKTLDLTPMTEEEAIDQMELLGHKFFMFLNGKSGEINVLYLRDNGGYGLLLPNAAQPPR